MSEVAAARVKPEAATVEPPVLLRELEPWHRVFLRNLGDTLLRREPPPVVTTATPVPVPRGYFIKTGVDLWRVAESYSGHILFVVMVYLVCTLPFFNPQPKLVPVQSNEISYYPVSEYLPPINTAAKAAMKPRHGAPKLAKQEILSVPPNADNNHQTIVTPPKIKLDHDVPLPNIVAWTPIPSTQPVAASARSVSQLKVPQFEPDVVAPAADVSKLHDKLQLPTLPQPSVVEPTTDVSTLHDKFQLPALPQPTVVEPKLTAEQLKLKSGNPNLAELTPAVAGPQHAGAGNSAGKDVPPSPSVQNLQAQGQGQIIALGLNPVDVHGPISMPNGNRSGEFHASPSGKADAPGSPNVVGTGAADNGGGNGKGNGVPAGIVVGAAPPGAATSAVGGTPNGTVGKGATPATNSNLDAQKRMLAAAMKPAVPSYRDRVAPPPANTVPEDPNESIEQRVFGRRRYYSQIMNMPNLTSATGSWIIRFAELKQSDDKTDLTAPVAMTKVDPAYPPDVLRDHVEGTVTLYAVIRTDGTVADIRVLDSLDQRLDQNAIQALSHWHFRPGIKNGEPVAVEAVVQIPFRMSHLRP